MADKEKTYYYLKLKRRLLRFRRYASPARMKDGYIYSDILLKLYFNELKTGRPAYV